MNSILVSDCDDDNISCFTDRNTFSKRQYFTNTDEKILFDIDETINSDNDFDSFWLDDGNTLPSQWMSELSSNKNLTQSSKKSKPSNRNNYDLNYRTVKLSSKDFDCSIKTSLDQISGRNELSASKKALSNKSSNISCETHNSSNLINNLSQGFDVNSELNVGNVSDRSFREKENNYHVRFWCSFV